MPQWTYLHACTPAELACIKSVYFLYFPEFKRPIGDFKFLDMLPNLRTLQLRDAWYSSLVNISAEEIEVVRERWRPGLRPDLERMREDQRKALVMRLQFWRPRARIVVRNVEKHDGVLRW
jgi:hypothetical protein